MNLYPCGKITNLNDQQSKNILDCKNMKLHKNTFFTPLFVLFALACMWACTSANPEVVNPSLVKVFVQTITNRQGNIVPTNVLVTELVPTPDNGTLLVGISNPILANKFSQGSLFLMKLSASGNRVWSKQYDTLTAGFPSNLLVENNNATFFWNSYDAVKDRATPSKYTYRRIQLNLSNSSSPLTFGTQLIEINCNNTKDGCGYIAKFIPSLANTGYAMISAGINTQTSNVHAVYLTILGSSATTSIPISTKIVTDLGEGIQPLLRLDSYLHLVKTSTNYFFNVPVEGQRMALVGTGDRSIVYADRKFWIANIQNGADNKVDVVTLPIDTVANAQYLPNLALLPNNTSFSNYVGFSTDLATPTLSSNYTALSYTLKNGARVIAGTSRQEGIILKVIAQNTEKGVVVKNVDLASGGYNVTSICESADGSTLFIAGNNRVAGGGLLAPFIVVLPTIDLKP